MKKRFPYLFGVLLTLLLLASMFAPAPGSRVVRADKENACKGLRNAYEACNSNNPDPSNCEHIRLQLIVHGCLGSSSGSGAQ
ncbi:MAG: hypothetical protein QOD75_1989 [Blastocatellia bacterium]|jgi:hypothetical protein|nr:hypothetical protein [Blastocatellia bacterium]